MAPLTDWLGGQTGTLYALGVNLLLALAAYMTLRGGVWSLASGAFMGLGAYSALLLGRDAAWPLWSALPVGAAAAALTALALGWPIARLPAPYVLAATLGLAVAFPSSVAAVSSPGSPLRFAPLGPPVSWLTMVAALLAIGYLVWHVGRARLGLAFAAVRQDETLAAAMGIAVGRHKWIALALGAAIAGLAGGLLVALTGTAAPGDFDLTRAVQVLAFGVIGGVEGAWGACLAALFVTLAPEWLFALAGLAPDPSLDEIALGVVLLLVALRFPGGLSGAPGTLRRRAGRRAARGDVTPAAELPAARRA